MHCELQAQEVQDNRWHEDHQLHPGEQLALADRRKRRLEKSGRSQGTYRKNLIYTATWIFCNSDRK